MNSHQLVVTVLGIGFSLLLFAPPCTTAWLLGTKRESRLWARLAGGVGYVWILFGLLANELVGPLQVTAAGQGVFLMLKHLSGGIVIGLLIAISTKRFEDH